jgi:hypothetical protein
MLSHNANSPQAKHGLLPPLESASWGSLTSVGRRVSKAIYLHFRLFFPLGRLFIRLHSPAYSVHTRIRTHARA